MARRLRWPTRFGRDGTDASGAVRWGWPTRRITLSCLRKSQPRAPVRGSGRAMARCPHGPRSRPDRRQRPARRTRSPRPTPAPTRSWPPRPGCAAVRMTRGVESPSRFVLLVEWDSVADHELNFRGTDRFPQWRAAIGPYFAGAAAGGALHRRTHRLLRLRGLSTPDGRAANRPPDHDPAGRRRYGHRRLPRPRYRHGQARGGHRGGARIHRIVATTGGPAGRRATLGRGGCGQLRLPRPRPIRRSQHRR